MNVTRFSLAALLLGASLTPALADSGDTGSSPLTVFQQSLAGPARAPLIEGRQATPVAAPAPLTDAERYLASRVRDQDR